MSKMSITLYTINTQMQKNISVKITDMMCIFIQRREISRRCLMSLSYSQTLQAELTCLDRTGLDRVLVISCGVSKRVSVAQLRSSFVHHSRRLSVECSTVTRNYRSRIRQRPLHDSRRRVITWQRNYRSRYQERPKRFNLSHLTLLLATLKKRFFVRHI